MRNHEWRIFIRFLTLVSYFRFCCEFSLFLFQLRTEPCTPLLSFLGDFEGTLLGEIAEELHPEGIPTNRQETVRKHRKSVGSGVSHGLLGFNVIGRFDLFSGEVNCKGFLVFAQRRNSCLHHGKPVVTVIELGTEASIAFLFELDVLQTNIAPVSDVEAVLHTGKAPSDAEEGGSHLSLLVLYSSVPFFSSSRMENREGENTERLKDTFAEYLLSQRIV